jgi:hypothetical protein
MPQGRFHQDQSGTKLNMLTLLFRTGEQSKNSSYKYMTRCDCGTEKVIAYSQMKNGKAKSCGCLQRRTGQNSPNFKHGLSQNRETEEYKRYQRECLDRFKYGLEPEHKQAILDSQNGCCAICGYKFGQKIGDMKVDHCHSTNVVRGLLCDLCNRGLGMFRDQTNRLSKAIEYLNKFALAR